MPLIPHGRYYTPHWVVELLLGPVYADIFAGERMDGPVHILEPAAGTGHILNAMAERWPTRFYVGVDIDESCDWPLANEGYWGDFLAERIPLRTMLSRFDWAVTNPPFKHARAFARRMMEKSAVTTILVRNSFLGSRPQNDFFRENPPSHIHFIPDRPKFHVPEMYRDRVKSSDNSEYCWVTWHRGITETKVHWLPQTPLSERKKG